MLGWRPLLISWLKTLPEGITDEHKELITGFFDRMVTPVLEWLRKGGAKVSELFINRRLKVKNAFANLTFVLCSL